MQMAGGGVIVLLKTLPGSWRDQIFIAVIRPGTRPPAERDMSVQHSTFGSAGAAINF